MSSGTRTIIVGATTVDVFVPAVRRVPSFGGDEFTVANLESLESAPRMRLGGNGAIAASVLGRLGESPILFTNVGEDDWGSWARARLEACGVQVRAMRPGLRTSVHIAVVDRSLRRMSLFYPGTTLVPHAGQLGQPELALVGGCPHPSSVDLARLLERLDGAITLLDIGPNIGQGFKLEDFGTVLPHLDILVANASELAAFTGLSAEEGAEQVSRQTRRGVVLKLGRGGATLYGAGGLLVASPALHVPATNTIGAGDTFNGGVLYGLGRGWGWQKVLDFSNRVAAHAVESEEGAGSVPRAEAILDAMQDDAGDRERRSETSHG